MSQERWKPITDFPYYLISDLGNVYNVKTESVMAKSRTIQGDLKVTLSSNGTRVTRSIRVLVAEAFVPVPPVGPGFHKSAIPDTVIILDNNQENVIAYNLAWRPRWFAHKYVRQFKQELPDAYHYSPVQNLSTGAIYVSVVEAGIREGLLFNDIFKSAQTRFPIYPNNHTFIFP